jgi:hypothetical protein
MAYIQFPTSCYYYSHRPRRDLIWMQSSCGHFCPFYGHWGNLWQDGWYYGQSDEPVHFAQVFLALG